LNKVFKNTSGMKSAKIRIEYGEKAPLGVFKSEVDPSSNQIDDDARKVLSSSDIIENAINEEEESSENTSGLKSAKIKMKNDPKNSGKILSMGFGFVEYDNMKNAKNALKAMQEIQRLRLTQRTASDLINKLHSNIKK
ncbi:15831_t:CDS:2, partial [Gigaspora rosea]